MEGRAVVEALSGKRLDALDVLGRRVRPKQDDQLVAVAELDGQPVRRSGMRPLVGMAPPEPSESQAPFERGGE